MKQPRIGIIDYSIGNLFSVFRACANQGLEPVITNSPKDLEKLDGIILPGVGAFEKGMRDLKTTGMDEAIRKNIDQNKPFFGICLGMQLLFEHSEEFGGSNGLGIIKGNVLPLKDKVQDLPVPKVAWDNLTPSTKSSWANSPLKSNAPSDDFYFVHSFYCSPSSDSDILAYASYGPLEYCAAIEKNNIFATQFHPEKSGDKGLRLYRNWKEKYFN